MRGGDGNRLPETLYPSPSSLHSSSTGDSPGKRATAGRQENPRVNSAPETSSKQKRPRRILKTSFPKLEMWKTVCWRPGSGAEPLRSGSKGRAPGLCRMVLLATTGTRWAPGTLIPERRPSLLQGLLQQRQIESVICARPAV